jgi:polysaccharide biosynthesis transport protein
MDIFFLLKVIWRKKLIWMVIPLITGAAAYLFTLNDVDWYVASAQLSTGYTQSDQIGLTNERFNSKDADIKFNNLLNSMNSGAPVNFISYRLLLHDLDSLNIPFHSPDKEKFKTNAAEIKAVIARIKVNLVNLKPLGDFR